MQFAPAGPTSCGNDKTHDGENRKNHPDQAPRQHGQGDQHGNAPVAYSLVEASSPGAQKKVKSSCELKRIDGFRDHDPGKQEHSDTGGRRQPGIETGSQPKETP